MFRELISQRTSVRSFKAGGVPASQRTALESFLKTQTTGPFGNRVRLTLLDVDKEAGESLRQYGTYGMIKGAETYIAGAVTKGTGDAEDYGYCMEKAILEATRLGLATVWLGGMLSRSRFGEKLAVAENEIVPAVSPVGLATERRSIPDHLVRAVAGSAKRKPFGTLFFRSSSLAPLSQSDAGALLDLLLAVQRAPSASNKQPWRLVLEGPRTHFYLDEDRMYNSMFKGISLQGVDMGIAMAHYELAGIDLENTGRWSIEPPSITTPWKYVITRIGPC